MQVLVNTYRYKTILGCDPQKNAYHDSERGKNSFKAFQFGQPAQNVRRSLSLSLAERTGLCAK